MDFTQTPFGVPDSVEDSGRINEILQESFTLQKKFAVSNACGIVSIILRHCFGAAGVNTDIVYGTNEFGGIRIPHMWLTMQNHIVDNTYVEDLTEWQYKWAKKQGRYFPESPTSGGDLFLGDESTKAKGIPNSSLIGFKWFFENQNKALILHRNNKSLRLYYLSMVKMMKEKYDVVVPDAFNRACWWCGIEKEGLKKCSACKLALYCGKQCQKSDWKSAHKEICLSPHSN